MKKFLRFIKKGFPHTNGRIAGLPLQSPVEVLRDTWGIPHIYAGNPRDLFIAQGFVHAQDRLWQMESMRRFISARLSQAAGPRMIVVDWASTAFGLPEMSCAALKTLSDGERAILQAYADGVNANLALRGRDLPFELRAMRISPQPWLPEDCLTFLVLISFQMTAGQYFRKLAALMERSHLTLEKWDDLFPAYPGDTPPHDPFFEDCGGLRFGRLFPWALAFHGGRLGKLPGFLRDAMLAGSGHAAGTSRGEGGNGVGGGHAAGASRGAAPFAESNNWVVARGPGGKPMLANDPHLSAEVPAPWYFCHLDSGGDSFFPDGIHAAGASVAGCPGITIGRNAHVAWGVTNVLLDSLDILILRVDPDDPTRYRIGDRRLTLERTEPRIRLPGGRERTLPVWRSVHGPAITAPEPGVEAVAVVKWYGTLPCDAIADATYRGVLSAIFARSAEEVLEAGRHWSFVAMNLVAADDRGHIGWHPTGAAPRRTGYTGRLPADASGGADWSGFLPYEAFPRVLDPPEGFIATANQRVTHGVEGTPFSYVWGPPSRIDRIRELLAGLSSAAVEDFKRLQLDVHSRAADALLPRILAMPFVRPAAREAVLILGSWDREVKADSAAAALWEVFTTEWSSVLLEKEWGKRLPLYFLTRGGYSVEDVLLDRPDSPLWQGTAGPLETLEKALVRAVRILERRLGRNRGAWAWGRLHRHVFHHPLGTIPLISKLLDPEPFPASGDQGTVNVSWFVPAFGGYEVTANPSMRMIVPLSDPDGMRVSAPLGQSGQPGHPHYDDLSPLWVRGDYVPLPMGREAVEAAAVEKLILRK